MLTHHGLKMLGCMKKCHTPNFIWFSIDPLETGIKISEFPLKNGDFQLLSTGVLSHCKLYIYRLYSDFLVCHHITIKESYSNAVFGPKSTKNWNFGFAAMQPKISWFGPSNQHYLSLCVFRWKTSSGEWLKILIFLQTAIVMKHVSSRSTKPVEVKFGVWHPLRQPDIMRRWRVRYKKYSWIVRL